MVDRTESQEQPGTPALVEPAHADLSLRLESLLFVSDGPVSVGRLAEALGVSTARTERGLRELEAAYAGRGLRLERQGNRV